MRINHIALYCEDLEAMRSFFLQYFDAFSNERYHNPRTGLSTYMLSFNEGSTRLELMSRPDVIPSETAHPPVGYHHLSFSLGSKEQVDKKTAQLSNNGYRVLSGPRTTGDGYYESSILGPENIHIELTV